MTSFVDDLRPASFRGVPFSVTDSSLTIGRRTKVFEYPQRDKPFVEDLGKSARTISVTAVFAGPDYITGMAKLLEAMEQEGSGVLVHPMLGSMNVTPTAATKVSYSTGSLGYSSATLEFTESGDYVFPSVSADTATKVKTAASGLSASALASFVKSFDLSNAQDFVVSTVQGRLSEYFGLDSYKAICTLFSVSDEMSDLAAKAVAYVNRDPAILGQAVLDAFGFSRAAYSMNSWRKVTRLVSRLAGSDGLNNSYQGERVTDEMTRAKTASLELQSLARAAVLSEAVSASSSVGGDDDTAGGGISYEDMISVRDEVLEAIDEEMFKCGDDDVYLALEEARAAVYEDMTSRAQDEARLITVTPPEVTPAVVLAYDIYEDASRDQEIVDRNGVRHGGFVPAKELKLLSR